MAAPAEGGSPEGAETAFVRADVGLAGEGSGEEMLLVEGVSAGFEQGDVDSLLRKAVRESEAGDAGADDADPRAEGLGAGCDLVEVYLHEEVTGVSCT